MARAATTTDSFNAIAEPRRRAILTLLAGRESPVGEIAEALHLAQPSVSKHLRVLRQVGMVRERRQGKQIFYQTRTESLQPLHAWVSEFARFWSHQLERVRERAEAAPPSPVLKR